MARSLTIKLKNLTRCNDGVTAVEFAVIAPVFMLIMMGIFEFSLIMFAMGVMESATNITARIGKTGFTAPGSTRQEQLIASINDRTAGLLDPNKITIDVKTYSTLTDVNDPEPFMDSNGNGVHDAGETYNDVNGNAQWDADMGIASAGAAGDIVVYTVTYPWDVMTPLVNTVIGNIFNVRVRTIVKNEPW